MNHAIKKQGLLKYNYLVKYYQNEDSGSQAFNL